MIATESISLTVEDFSGQLRRRVNRVPRTATIGELVSSLVDELHLPANDSQGRPLTYGARARGSSLPESEVIGEALEHEDVVTLTQNVTAG